MISDRARIAASFGIVALAAGLTWGMALGRASSDLLFYACAFVQAGASLVAGRLAAGNGSRAALAIMIAGAVLLRLWFVAQVPTLSGDVYRYVWDGRVVNAGFNPYLHVPADPALIPLRDPRQYGLIDKREYAVAIYPPVAQALFAIVTRLSGAVWAMKLTMVLLEGVAVLATMRLLVRLGRPPGLVATYLLHPAPLWEFAGNGHVDAAMMAFLFVALAWGGPTRPYRAALLMTLGALVKPTAALGLPALWRPMQIKLPIAVLALALFCYLPFIGAGAGVAGFLPNYAHEQGLDTGQGIYWLALLQNLGLFRPGMTAGYAVLAGALLLGLALYFRWSGAIDLRTALRGTAMLLIVFLLLLSPTFPWYFLVALPMTPLLGLWSPFALTTGGFLLYGFNADAPPLFGRWSAMIGLAVLAALYDLTRVRQQETTT
jgi:hypothetical protein